MYICDNIYRLILLRMRIVSGKSCVEDQNSHCMFNNFFSESCAIYDILCKNKVEPDRPHENMVHVHCHSGVK